MAEDLAEKIRKIDALISSTKSDGEREAAVKIREKLLFKQRQSRFTASDEQPRWFNDPYSNTSGSSYRFNNTTDPRIGELLNRMAMLEHQIESLRAAMAFDPRDREVLSLERNVDRLRAECAANRVRMEELQDTIKRIKETSAWQRLKMLFGWQTTITRS